MRKWISLLLLAIAGAIVVRALDGCLELGPGPVLLPTATVEWLRAGVCVDRATEIGFRDALAVRVCVAADICGAGGGERLGDLCRVESHALTHPAALAFPGAGKLD